MVTLMTFQVSTIISIITACLRDTQRKDALVLAPFEWAVRYRLDVPWIFCTGCDSRIVKWYRLPFWDIDNASRSARKLRFELSMKECHTISSEDARTARFTLLRVDGILFDL